MTASPIDVPVDANPNTPAPTSKSPESNRPLNVTDPLSYLDAGFKSQVIDTPGVIERVSTLFHGNRVLIQGFNTFLPMGYRIDVSKNPAEPHIITVTTPSGTTTQTTQNAYSTSPASHATFPALALALPILLMPFAGMGGPAPLLPPLPSGPASRSMTPLYHVRGPTSPASLRTAATTVLSKSPTNDRRGLLPRLEGHEFNHAIQYLNKIKQRYADDPNTYKQFLDILQTYQKKQKHLQDSQVYVQVQHLFKDAPDLMAEFKAFLPVMGGAMFSGPAVGHRLMPHSKNLPKKPAQQHKRKKRIIEKDPTPVPPTTPSARPAKKQRHHHDSPSSFSGYVGHSPPPPSPIQMPPPPFHQPIPPPPPGLILGTSADKLLFFDRAKKALENRQMYEDFLKLLSLFSKQVIDMKTLIEHTRDAFLGDGELMTEFKELVGWDETLNDAEKGPPGSIRTGPPEALSALPADDGEGPSYRRLPESESRLACSGRDELCRSMLNDGWVSHPTWASEDVGFVSHKKNSFEDALHKSEKERHEYHVQIAVLTRTIAHFEPLALRIEEMTSEERATFKLKPDFGGSGKCIYHRILKKIYGRDGGMEIIQALQDAPVKDEDWRRAQREWARTWREFQAERQEEHHREEHNALDHASRSGRRSNGSVHFASNGVGVAAGDLRKKLLRTAQEKSELGAASSRAQSPSVFDFADVWVKETTHVVGVEGVNGHSANARRPFFANTTFYTLLRLLQLLYSRLSMCKAIGARLAEEKHASLLVNPVALGFHASLNPIILVDSYRLPLVLQRSGSGTLLHVHLRVRDDDWTPKTLLLLLQHASRIEETLHIECYHAIKRLRGEALLNSNAEFSVLRHFRLEGSDPSSISVSAPQLRCLYLEGRRCMPEFWQNCLPPTLETVEEFELRIWDQDEDDIALLAVGALTSALLVGVGPLTVFKFINFRDVELQSEAGHIRHLRCWNDDSFFDVEQVWRCLSLRYDLHKTVREIRMRPEHWHEYVEVFERFPPGLQEGLTLDIQTGWEEFSQIVTDDGDMVEVFKVMRLPGLSKVKFYGS
ncbi:hypothetical protein R3P38DRAFT_3177166 [Favolaschia claudopus]|uniref:Histone deacetylase interacting domain-containing protein n=1 Tax=Favolaschia claudopus TaxID=2862362 RepID=A0AAW0D2I8_9AGAR